MFQLFFVMGQSNWFIGAQKKKKEVGLLTYPQLINIILSLCNGFYQGLFRSVFYTIDSQAQVCSPASIHITKWNGLDEKWNQPDGLAAPHEKKAWKSGWIDYVLRNFTFFYLFFPSMELCIFFTRRGKCLKNAFGGSFWSSKKFHLHWALLLHGNQKKWGRGRCKFSCFFLFSFLFLVVTSHHIGTNILKRNSCFFIFLNSPKIEFLIKIAKTTWTT